ncbi:MAG TPA: hypothetical protein VND41_05160 [Nitrososphaerales archaeon]|nr:hypothetical protein [Nitrososphaerales archaeon]
MFKNALVAASASLAISAASYFMTVEGVNLWLPKINAMGTAIVHGFPIPYTAYFPTNESSYLYYPLNFVGDFSIWFVIFLLVASAFTVRRLVLASFGGLAVTAFTLLLPSLALATPEDLPVVCSGTPMGFPFEYLFRLDCTPFGGVSYEFSPLSAVVDYGLWLGVAFSVIGLSFFLVASIRRHGILKVSAVIGVVILLAIGANVALIANSEYLSASCNSLGVNSKNLPVAAPGYEYVCGRNSVSDGRLSITLNNYHFVDGTNIDWQCSSAFRNGSSGCIGIGGPGVYLIVNATVENVGGGGAHMGPFFDIWLKNDSGGPSFSSGEYDAAALFPGQSPNMSVPAPSSTYLPPDGSVSYWFIFNMPDVTLNGTQGLKLQYLVWQEFSYGEILNDSGQWECPCSDTQVRLAVLG